MGIWPFKKKKTETYPAQHPRSFHRTLSPASSHPVVINIPHSRSRSRSRSRSHSPYVIPRAPRSRSLSRSRSPRVRYHSRPSSRSRSYSPRIRYHSPTHSRSRSHSPRIRYHSPARSRSRSHSLRIRYHSPPRSRSRSSHSFRPQLRSRPLSSRSPRSGPAPGTESPPSLFNEATIPSDGEDVKPPVISGILPQALPNRLERHVLEEEEEKPKIKFMRRPGSIPSHGPSPSPDMIEDGEPRGRPRTVKSVLPSSASSTKATPTGREKIWELMSIILGSKALYKELLNSKGEKAQYMLDIMQKMLDHPNTQGALRRSILIAMMRLCSESGTHPRCLTLQHIRYDTRPVAAGQFGEVWKGYLGDKRVCLKVPKLYQDTQIEHLLKNSTREGIVWSDLEHPNLLPFYGTYHLGDHDGRVCLVSPWMDNGSVSDYLRANPEVPRLPLVSDVLAGLGYLHEHSIVHGDLKGANILISSGGSACLADFGLSSIVDAEIVRWTSLETTSRIGGTIRWEAPELLDFEEGGIPRPTFPSDVYSLASVMYEILTGQVPYHEFPRDVTILSKVMRGVKPSRPSDFEVELSDEIWAIMEGCWNHDPAERPTVPQAAERWSEISPPLLTTRRMSRNQGRRSEDNLQILDPRAFRAVIQGFDTNFSESDIDLLREYAHRDETIREGVKQGTV